MPEFKSQFQNHPFHLVAQSPWPFLISFTLFFMVIGATSYLHGGSGYLFILGFLLTLSIMYMWLEDVDAEGTLNGNHTKEVKKGITFGFYLFIVSEVFVFLSVFWAYFHSSIVPAVEIGGVWPPAGVTPLDPFAIPLLNTFILVSSGAFVTYGHHALIAGKRAKALYSIFLTILLAVVFTALQGFEYFESSFSMSDSVFGSTFFASTGLHGLHVIVGTIFIVVAYFRIFNYHVTKQTHVGVEAGIVYWHFVDVVWLFLYFVVYYWSYSF